MFAPDSGEAGRQGTGQEGVAVGHGHVRQCCRFRGGDRGGERRYLTPLEAGTARPRGQPLGTNASPTFSHPATTQQPQGQDTEV